MTFDTAERVVESAAILWAVRPVAVHCASLDFRRMAPRLARAMAIALACYVAATLALALLVPIAAMRAVAVLAVAGMAALAWVASPARGASRGWPTGRLAPLQLGYWFDRTFFIDNAARHGRTFKTCQFHRPTACIVGLNRGFAYLERHEADLTSPPLPFTRFVPGGFLRFMPPDRHEATKARLRRAIGREYFEPNLARLALHFKDGVARMADAAANSGTAPRAHVQRAAFAAWMKLFYGVESDTPDFARLKAAYRVIDIRNPTGASDDAITRAGAEIVSIARAAAARDAGLDVPPSFVAALARQSGALDEDTVLHNLAYMCHTTWGDISGLLTWVFRMLVDNPEWADRLRDTQRTGAPGEAAALAGRIVQETLRLEQSEHLYRVAMRDIADEDGTVVPKGWLIRVCVRESHRDPSVFDAAETFNPDRFERRTFTRREYSPFGAGGRTACIGEGLTRMVAAVFAEEVVRGWRWRTANDGPPEYGPWRHWRPSSNWRVTAMPA